MTTRLEILNHVLGVAGISPVTSDESQHPMALSAMVQINRVDKELQKRGWWFNTEFSLELNPNESGEIIVPSGTLFLWPIDRNRHLVRRGSRLYDPQNHTYTLNDPVSVDLILQLPIEDLPEAAAMYVQHQAALDFYVNEDGDEIKAKKLATDVATAWAELQRSQLKASNVNAMSRPITAVLRSRISRQGVTYSPLWPGGRGQ